MTAPDPTMLAYIDELRRRCVRGDFRALAVATVANDGREQVSLAVGSASEDEWDEALADLVSEMHAGDEPEREPN